MVLECFPKKSPKKGLPTTLLSLHTLFESFRITYSFSSILYLLSYLKTRNFSKSNKLIKKNLSKISLTSLTGISSFYLYKINYENEKIENLAEKFQNDEIRNCMDNYLSVGFLSGSTVSILFPKLKYFRCVGFGGFLFYWVFLANEIGLGYFGMNLKVEDVKNKFF